MPEISRSAAPTAAKPQSGMIAELSWKVRPWMAVLESHARNQPERSTDRGEAAIRDDCRASWKVRPGMAVLEPYARNGRGRRIAATEQRSGTIAPIPPGRDARTKSVPGRDRRR